MIPQQKSATVFQIPVDLIDRDPHQARRKFDQDGLSELARSIAKSGVIQPIIIRSVSGGRYELVAGERRWRATQIAGLHEIPAVVRDDLDDEEARVFGLIENLQRESLSPMEAAQGMHRLAEHASLTHEQLGEQIGKSREYVTNFLRLLKLIPAVGDLVDAGELSIAHGKLIATWELAQQLPLAREVIASRMTVRALELRLRGLKAKPAAHEKASSSSRDHQRFEQRLSDYMGYSVQVVESQPGKGEFRVRFNSLDELDGILDKVGYRAD